MSVHLIHECWHCGEDCWCPFGDVDPHACVHQCRERAPRVPDEFEDQDDECDFTDADVIT